MSRAPLLRHRLLAGSLIAAFASFSTATTTFSQAFTVTLEAPGTQDSSIFRNPNGFGATKVIQENFEELPIGLTKGFPQIPFAGNSALGSWNQVLIRAADSFGGAGGTGHYLTVNRLLNKADTSSTLTLSTPQRYFGLWWSAGDRNNILSFYSGSTLLETFHTSDVVKSIDEQPDKSAYFGNPNNGRDAGEPFSYLNFFADPSNPNETFDRVVVSNLGGTGFEQDNETIASTYTSVSGIAIAPINALTIGGDPGSNGSFGVNGGSLSVTTNTTVGGSGNGSLVVVNSGIFNSGTITIGDRPGSNGITTVDGKGSQLNAIGNLAVGEGGNGALIVTNGGNVQSANTTVGNRFGSTGNVTVDGPVSELESSGILTVGPGGSGIVSLSNGGIVTSNGGAIVGPGGILTGNGTIETPTLINSGMVAPGGRPKMLGTLAIRGNYQQGPRGVLEISVSGPQVWQADQLRVQGTAALNGTLALASLNAFHPSSSTVYEILTAKNGVTGNFNQVTDTLNTQGLTRTIVVAPNGVLLSYLRPLSAPTIPPAQNPPTVVMQTPQSLPAALTNARENAILVPLLNPTAEQLASLYEIWFSDAKTQRFNVESRFYDLAAGSMGFVSNVSYAGISPGGNEVVERGGAADEQHVRKAAPSFWQATPENRWGVWATGYGDFVNVENDDSAKGYSFTTGGVTLGIDYRLTRHLVVGLMGGYSHSWTDLQPSGSVDVDSGCAGLYAGYFDQGFYIDGAIYGGHYALESARTGLLGIAKGSSEGGELSTYIAGGYDLHLAYLTIGPTMAFQYTYAGFDGFSENGSVAPVRVSSDSQDSLSTDLGFRATDSIPVGAVVLRPFVRVVWEHEFDYSTLPLSVSLVDIPGSPTRVAGPGLGQDSLAINSGVSVQWTQSFSTYLSYDGQLGRNHYNSNGVRGGLRWAF